LKTLPVGYFTVEVNQASQLVGSLHFAILHSIPHLSKTRAHLPCINVHHHWMQSWTDCLYVKISSHFSCKDHRWSVLFYFLILCFSFKNAKLCAFNQYKVGTV